MNLQSAIAVSEAEIDRSWRSLASEEGILMCPEGAATHAAWLRMVEADEIGRDEKVVLYNCATGLKYELPKR